MRLRAPVQALLNAVTEVDVLQNGTVVLRHASGSYVAFRADGNIDIYAARNLRLSSEEDFLLNCTEEFDTLSSKERKAATGGNGYSNP